MLPGRFAGQLLILYHYRWKFSATMALHYIDTTDNPVRSAAEVVNQIQGMMNNRKGGEPNGVEICVGDTVLEMMVAMTAMLIRLGQW